MKFQIIFTIFVLLITKQSLAQCSGVYSALVFDNKDKQILFENHADAAIYPASLTKIMTLYLAFDSLAKKKLYLQDLIAISANAQDVGEINKHNTLHLKEGDKITVESAIKMIVVRSFNEAAIALAEKVAGDEWHFVKMMNKKAFALKMFHTNFRNVTGFHDVGQYSTSYDLARLVVSLEKEFPQYRKYFANKEFFYKGAKYTTTNRVLLEYKGANGFKTGFTTASGYNLIASARRVNVDLKSILIGCETYQKRDEFTKDLLDASFKRVASKKNDVIVRLK